MNQSKEPFAQRIFPKRMLCVLALMVSVLVFVTFRFLINDTETSIPSGYGDLNGSHKENASPEHPGANSIKPQEATGDITVDKNAVLDHELIAIGSGSIERAIAFIKANYPPEIHQRALGFLMEEISKERLSAINEISPLITSTMEREGALSSIALYWANKNAAEAIHFGESNMTGVLKNNFLGQMTYALSHNYRFDEAAALVDKMPFSSARTSAIEQLGLAYSASKPTEALKWASGLTLPEDRDAALRRLMLSFSQANNMDGLNEMLSLNIPEKIKASALRQIGRISGGTGEQMQPFAGKLSPETRNGGLLLAGAIISAPANQLPDLGKQLLIIKDPTVKALALDSYLSRLFQQSEQQAIQWINQSPADMRPDALRVLVNKWYNTDSLALSDWVNTLPKGPDRDVALDTMANMLRISDPKAAADVAAQVSDQRVRQALQRQLGVPLK